MAEAKNKRLIFACLCQKSPVDGGRVDGINVIRYRPKIYIRSVSFAQGVSPYDVNFFKITF